VDLSVTYTVNNNGLRKIKPLSDASTLSERLRSREQLRSGNKQSATIFLPFTRLLLSALNKLPDVKGLTVYRGINAKLPEVDYSPETLYQMQQFNSCTRNGTTINQFLGNSGDRVVMLNVQTNEPLYIWSGARYFLVNKSKNDCFIAPFSWP
jgi:hypothetical protein